MKRHFLANDFHGGAAHRFVSYLRGRVAKAVHGVRHDPVGRVADVVHAAEGVNPSLAEPLVSNVTGGNE